MRTCRGVPSLCSMVSFAYAPYDFSHMASMSSRKTNLSALIRGFSGAEGQVTLPSRRYQGSSQRVEVPRILIFWLRVVGVTSSPSGTKFIRILACYLSDGSSIAVAKALFGWHHCGHIPRQAELHKQIGKQGGVIEVSQG